MARDIIKKDRPTPITLTMPTSEVNLLEQQARNELMTKSELIRKTIRKYLKECGFEINYEEK